MSPIDKETVIVIAQKFYKISPVEDQIVAYGCYKENTFLITDATSEKKYLLEIVNPIDSSNGGLIAIIDQVNKNAYDFSVKHNLFSTPNIVRTCSGKLSEFDKIEFNNNKIGKKGKKVVNVKLFEFLPGPTITLLINKCEFYSPGREGLYRRLGFLCGNIAHFFKTQSKYLDKLASKRIDSLCPTSNFLGTVSMFARILYPVKTHPRRIMIDQVLEEFRSIEDKLDALPKRILHGALAPRRILLNYKKSQVNPRANDECQKLHFTILDFQETQVGPLCVEVAVLILNCILEKRLIDDVPFASIVEIPKSILQGFKHHSASNEFFSNGQLKLLPTVIKFLLCQSVLGEQYALGNDPTNEFHSERNEYSWILLSFWLDLFSYNDQIIDVWSRSDYYHVFPFPEMVLPCFTFWPRT